MSNIDDLFEPDFQPRQPDLLGALVHFALSPNVLPLLIPLLCALILGPILVWRYQVAEHNKGYQDVNVSPFTNYHVHSWLAFSYTPQPRYCTACRQLISGFILFVNMGYECQICGICAHHSCVRVCEKTNCKTPGRIWPFSHQFREGNLTNSAACSFCGVVCSTSFSLFGLECLWCRRTFHQSCFERARDLRHRTACSCDLGPLVTLILPPPAVTLVKPASLPMKETRQPPRVSRASSAPPWRPQPSPRSGRSRRRESRKGRTNQTSDGPDECRRATNDYKRASYGYASLRDSRSSRCLQGANVSVQAQALMPHVARRSKRQKMRDMFSKAQHDEEDRGPPVVSARHFRKWQLIGQPAEAPPSWSVVGGRSSEVGDDGWLVHWQREINEYLKAVKETGGDDFESKVSVSPSPVSENCPSPMGLEEPSAPRGNYPILSLDSAKETLSKMARSLGRASRGEETTAASSVAARDKAFCQAVSKLHRKLGDLVFEIERFAASPIIVFVNPKSGGQLGQQLLREFYALLNPWQVVDMSVEKVPRDSLRRFRALAMTGRMRILACGGDGTVSWLINAALEEYAQTMSFACLSRLHRLCRAWSDGALIGSLARLVATFDFESVHTPVAVLPLGTGNDLAKVLNWGAAFENPSNLLAFMRKLVFAKPMDLDLWTMEIYTRPPIPPPPRRFALSKPAAPAVPTDADNRLQLVATKTFTNYIDFGIAARIALKFHLLRDAHPELFRSRLGNKFLYGEVGVRDFLVDQPIDLGDTEIQCDEVSIDLRPLGSRGGIEGLAVVNIPSFGGGVEPWKGVANTRRRRRRHTFLDSSEDALLSDGEEESDASSSDASSHFSSAQSTSDTQEASSLWSPQKMQDGRIEVIAFRSLLHLGRVQVGLAQSVKVAQGRHLTFQIKSKVPYQVDGEPCWLEPCVVKIFWKCKVPVLTYAASQMKSSRRKERSTNTIRDEERLNDLETKIITSDKIQKVLQEALEAGELSEWQSLSIVQRLKEAVV